MELPVFYHNVFIHMLFFYFLDLFLQWQVWNNGSRNAVGYKCDTAYLSEDSSWDVTDYQLGRSLCAHISISPAELRADPAMQPLGLVYSTVRSTPFIAQKNYSCIVRTRTNIRDPNLSNNIGISTMPVRVNAPALFIGVPTNLSIDSGSELVYKIDNIPSENTLIATLTATQNSGFHDLFLRHRNPPTASKYDAFSLYSLSHNQTAVLHNTKPGTYYVRIRSFGRDIQPYLVQLEVKLATFEVTHVSPSSAAPIGNVTVRLSGTLIGNRFQAALINDATNSTVITASTVYWFSSVEVYATFDIRNLSIGPYTIQLTNTKTNQGAQLRNSFTISNGIPGQVSARIDAPRNLLRGESTIIGLFVQNTGNTDIRTPIVFIRGSRNVQLRVIDTVGEPDSDYAQELLFLPIPLYGPSGIISPGVTTKTLLRVLPNNFRSSFFDVLSVSFLDERELDYPHLYVDRKQELKPKDIPDDSWNIIWNHFLGSVGETWRSMTNRLSEIANELSMGQRRIKSVDELVDFQLRIAQGGFGPVGECKLFGY